MESKFRDKEPIRGRHEYREGLHFKESTFGLYPGKLQLNVAMLSNDFKEDFYKFCSLNKSCCPLVHFSTAGDYSADDIAKNMDIRTDIAAYNAYKDGEYCETIPNLLHHPWNDMVSFYLGCSFSFDDKLIEKGYLEMETSNVSMYTTNIECIPVNRFQTPMVVSMRKILKRNLKDVFQITMNMDFCHGAPIQIGCPEDIGIKNVMESDFGHHPKELMQDEIPVFWACGVTSSMAIKSAKLPICFSHSPGSMLVADTNSCDAHHLYPNTAQYATPEIVKLDDKRYSVISQNSWKQILSIEKITNCKHESLGKAILLLSRAPNVAMFSSCPNNLDLAILVYLLKPLLYLGKQVRLCLDGEDNNRRETLRTFCESMMSNSNGKVTILPDYESSNVFKETNDVFILVGENQNIYKDLLSCGTILTFGNDTHSSFCFDYQLGVVVAMVMALFISSKCTIHDRYRRFGLGERKEMKLNDFFFAKDEGRELLEYLKKCDDPQKKSIFQDVDVKVQVLKTFAGLDEFVTEAEQLVVNNEHILQV